MLTTNIIGKLNSKSEILNSKQILNPKSQRSNILNLGFRVWSLFRISSLGFRIFICLSGLFLLIGCNQANDLNQAQQLTKESESYYQKAVAKYKDLIVQGKDPDKLYFELGNLYFSRGEFREAGEAFIKSNDSQAKKFLGISYYRLGDFTGALEVFNKYESQDGEYLYYKGLTSEKLNLFDQALGDYKKIKDKEFLALAKERINSIEKQASPRNIKEIDPQVAKVLASAPKEENYPQAGALILTCDELIEVTPENTEVSYLHYVIKILNERGKEDFSEAKIDYDSTYEKVELEYARTIKPDGAVVEVGSRHIRDVSKYLNFPLYSNARVYIISFPEITEGASIEYKLKIYRNKLINKKDFVIPYQVQATDPIIAADFTVTFPKDNPAAIKLINEQYNNFGGKLTPRTEEKDGLIRYHWQFKDIPQIVPESNMPPQVQINPTIFISSFKSWKEVYDWWWQLAKDKIQADPAIKDKVKELTGALKTEEEKIRAIYNFCARDIRYVAVEYGQAGYEPHQAADIFRNKYGDCKDQAILLVTMLKEAGCKAYPVLIATREAYNLNEDLPSMLFNHCIACVIFQEKRIFLDPTAETCPFGDLPDGDQGRKVFICQEDDFKIADTPLYSAGHNLVKQVIKLKTNNDESITGEKDIFTFGVWDQGQRYWLLYTQPELIEAQLKERIQDFSIGAKLENYSIENLDDLNRPVVLKYSFRGPEYFSVAGNLRIMPQLSGLDLSLVAREGRRYPIDFSFLGSEEKYLEIKIPDSLRIKYVPENVSQDSPWMKFSGEYSRKGNALTFWQKTEFKKKAILQDEYADFKKFYENLAKKIKQRVVLERVK